MGHSAGTIILGHLLEVLAARRLDERKLSEQVAGIHLYAPACTVQFANRYYAPHAELMQRAWLHVLGDERERDDNVAAVYRKSLLYLVSNALEPDLRTPILGLEKVNDPQYNGWDGSSTTGEALNRWRDAARQAGLQARTVVTRNARVPVRKSGDTMAADHGSFDNNIEVVGGTLELITGGKLAVPVDDLRGF